MDESKTDGEVMERLARDVLARLETGGEGPHVRYVGDYELEEEIARGGMGVVYRARQTSLGRPVALKMILAGRFASAEDVARFRLEAEAAAGLSHPGIVPIHEVGIHEGHHYFSMEYVEGRSLERIGNGAPIEPRRAGEYARAIAEAVQYAHERGVLHRDLKPSNVLLDREGRVRITDFGLAKRSTDPNDLTGTGQILGTPGYMAPEQACGRSIDVTADVYSIGAILYELITGRAPFVAQTPMAVLLLARDSDPVPPVVLNPRVPSDLATICLAALEKSPEKRYRSASELAADLQRYLDGEPVMARPAGLLRRMAMWTERNPWSISAAVTLGAVLLACIAYGFYAQAGRLQWLVEHPGAPSPPRSNPFRDELREWWVFVYLPLFWIPMDVTRRSCGLTLRQFRNRRIPRVLGRRQISPRLLALYGTILILGLLYSAALVKLAIDDFVWLDRLSFSSALGLLLLWYVGACLAPLGREVRATLHGVPPRTYSAEEVTEHVDALAVLIQRYLRIGMLEDAKELCDHLRALYPERPEWMELQADLHRRKGEGADAAKHFAMAARQAELMGGYTDDYVEKLEQRGRECAPG